MHRASGYPRGRGERNVTTRNRSGEASLLRDSAHELRTELARKIALFIGSAENRATDIPGLTLHRRTAPTAPCSMTYEPSVTVIAKGRKAASPDNALAWVNRAVLHQSAGDPVGAADMLRRAIAAEPAKAEWHERLGWLLMDDLGLLEDAGVALRDAVACGSLDKEV